MSEPEFILTSDGGSDERTSGAGACILHMREDQHRLKLVGMLGPMSGSQAELSAALIGWCAVAELNQRAEAHVHWIGDNEALLSSAMVIRAWRERGWRTNADRAVANRGLWEAFIQLTEGQQLSVAHIRGHSGHRENEACDRAARWIQRTGDKLLTTQGPGKIGQLARSTPSQAWVLIDARTPFRSLLESTGLDADGTRVSEAVGSLRKLLRPHLFPTKR